MALDDYIDLDLTDVDTNREPIPSVLTTFIIAAAERLHKEGADWPYIKLTLSPQTGEPKVDRRKLFLNLSFHPGARWNMKLLHEAVKLPMKGFRVADYLGRKFSCTPKIVASNRDPQQKVNEISPPYYAAVA